MEIQSIPLFNLLKESCLALGEKCTAFINNSPQNTYKKTEDEKELTQKEWENKREKAYELAEQFDAKIKQHEYELQAD